MTKLSQEKTAAAVESAAAAVKHAADVTAAAAAQEKHITFEVEKRVQLAGDRSRLGLALVSGFFLFVTAAVSSYTAYKMAQLERNTNSMKDALVLEVRKAALLKGANDERMDPGGDHSTPPVDPEKKHPEDPQQEKKL